MSSSDNKFYDKESKIWRGDVESLIYGDEDSIGSVAIKKMLQHPEHINQVSYKKTSSKLLGNII